jgi:hypothetical protein
MSEAIPKGFPAPTTEAQLALCTIASHMPEKLVPVTDKLYRGFWEDGDSDVLTSSGLLHILKEELGADNAKIILEQVSIIYIFSSIIIFDIGSSTVEECRGQIYHR